MVALEDDSLFIGALHFWGVSHPPGYPAHTFFGGLFYRLLPFLSPAYKAHLFSGFAAAAACAAVYAVVAMFIKERAFALLAAAAFAASKTFWSQAIIAEVYTLNAFLFFFVFALCLAAVGRNDNRLLVAAAIVYGVGLANHYPLLMLATPGLAVIALPLLRRRLLNLITLPLVAMATAALFYLWMVWRSHHDIDYNFYGAINDWEQFWFYVSRSGYANIDNQAGVGWEDKITYIRFLSSEILWQFTPVGFAFAVVGFFTMLRSQRLLCFGLSLSFFCSSFLLIYLLNFEALALKLAIFRVYPIIAYGVMAIWLAWGAASIVALLRLATARRVATAAIIVIITAATGAAHWNDNNRRHYRWANDFAQAKLQSVEFGAAVFLYDDLDLPLGYLHYVKGVRRDLTIYNSHGLIYRNRLFPVQTPNFPPADSPNTTSVAFILQNFIRSSHRPVYYHPQQRALFYSPSDFSGFFNLVSRDQEENRLVLSRQVLRWLSDTLAVNDAHFDIWTRFQIRSAVLQIVFAFNEHEDELRRRIPQWRDITARVREKYPIAQIAHFERNMNRMNATQLTQAMAWANAFDIKKASFLDKVEKSQFYLLRARLSRLAGVDDGYGENLQTALEQLATTKNPAVQPLLVYYFNRGYHCEFYDIAAMFYPQSQDMPLRARRLLAIAAKHCHAA